MESPDDLQVSIDAEGVVRCPGLVDGDAVLMTKAVLEALLTETYSMALSFEGRSEA